MPEIISKNPGDCVLSAMSFHTGIDYDTWERYARANKFYPCYKLAGGTNIGGLMQTLRYRRVKTPRRGQDNIFSAIATFGTIQRPHKHAAVIVEGRVYDAGCPNGVEIREYRRRFGYNLNGLWVKES